MTKISKIFVGFVIGPVFLAMLNWLFSGRNFFSWAYYRTNEISMIALAVSFFGALFGVYFNYRSGTKSIKWYFIYILSAIFSVGYLYIINSLSNFGF